MFTKVAAGIYAVDGTTLRIRKEAGKSWNGRLGAHQFVDWVVQDTVEMDLFGQYKVWAKCPSLKEAKVKVAKLLARQGK